MTRLINDRFVNAITFGSTDGREAERCLVRVEGPPEAMVIINSLNFFCLDFSVMAYIASGVYDRAGIGDNGTGFRYPTDDLDPGEVPLDGVEICNPLGELQMSVASFEELMTYDGTTSLRRYVSLKTG